MKTEKYYQLKGIAEEGQKTIKVWCPYCKVFHVHGWKKEYQKLKKGSHRVAHCFDYDSPFKQTGYYIKAFSKKDLK